MTRNFCTLADSKYRIKLLALHQSMVEHIKDFRLYILCLDDALHGLLSHLALENVTLIKLEDFLDSVLEAKREDRSLVEWYWTMTPSLALWLLRGTLDPGIEELAYLDADLLFFGGLVDMYEEIGDADVMVIPHRFPPGLEKDENGIYNVSLVWWKRTENAMACLKEWRVQCLDWCHCWPSKGRFADQGYLNDWPEKYGAHVLEHLGCNLAPWNMGQYTYAFLDFPGPGESPEIVIYPTEEMGRGFKLRFFHFHEFKVNREATGDFYRGHYVRTPFIEKHIYAPYERALRNQVERIRSHVRTTR